MTRAEAGPRTALEILAAARASVEPALRAAVDRLPPSLRLVAGYHMGWWDAEGTPARVGGKAVRAALTLSSAEATGGSRTAAVPAAVAVELAHNFSLLHDDVMDGDHTRRHRPTAWTVYGAAEAIVAGDAMLALAGQVLAEAQPDGNVAVGRLTASVVELCEGQYVDLSFERRGAVGVDECTAMARAKTGALMECACALGAMSGPAGPDEVAALAAFGRELGLAFQLVDDLLGIWGDPRSTGKPAHADLARRKKTLPVVAAMAEATPVGRQLARQYRLPAGDDDEAAELAHLVEQAGGRAWATSQTELRLEEATTSLREAVPDRRRAADLLTLARFVTRRAH